MPSPLDNPLGAHDDNVDQVDRAIVDDAMGVLGVQAELERSIADQIGAAEVETLESVRQLAGAADDAETRAAQVVRGMRHSLVGRVAEAAQSVAEVTEGVGREVMAGRETAPPSRASLPPWELIEPPGPSPVPQPPPPAPPPITPPAACRVDTPWGLESDCWDVWHGDPLGTGEVYEVVPCGIPPLNVGYVQQVRGGLTTDDALAYLSTLGCGAIPPLSSPPVVQPPPEPPPPPIPPPPPPPPPGQCLQHPCLPTDLICDDPCIQIWPLEPGKECPDGGYNVWCYDGKAYIVPCYGVCLLDCGTPIDETPGWERIGYLIDSRSARNCWPIPIDDGIPGPLPWPGVDPPPGALGCQTRRDCAPAEVTPAGLAGWLAGMDKSDYRGHARRWLGPWWAQLERETLLQSNYRYSVRDIPPVPDPSPIPWDYPAW